MPLELYTDFKISIHSFPVGGSAEWSGERQAASYLLSLEKCMDRDFSLCRVVDRCSATSKAGSTLMPCQAERGVNFSLFY